MIWRMLVFSFKNKLIGKVDTLHKLENSAVQRLTRFEMEPAKKKAKFVPEECELIVNIDHKGGCFFNVISKVESFIASECDRSDKRKKKSKPGQEHFHSVSDQSSELNIFDDKAETRHKDSREKKDIVKLEKEIIDNDIHVNPEKAAGEDEVTDEKSDDSSVAKCVLDSAEADAHKEVVKKSLPPTCKYVSLDCEFVGITGDKSALGRCSIVDFDGKIICDIYARPLEKIFTYRTKWSGITRQHMTRAIPIESALSQISDIIKDKIVVGHGIHNDFRVLGFGHPGHLIRDTQRSRHLNSRMGMKSPISLKNMADKLLGVTIQTGSHCSVIDARTTMELFKLVRVEWETSLLQNGASDDPDFPEQAFGDTEHCEESCDNLGTSKAFDKMTALHNIHNGRVNKKKKKKKKLQIPFGLLTGTQKMRDYFKDTNNADSGFIGNGLNRSVKAALKTQYDENVKELLCDKYWLNVDIDNNLFPS